MTGNAALAEQIFHEAIAVPAEERAALLDRVCGRDRELRELVASLIAADGEGSAVFGSIEREAGLLTGGVVRATRIAAQERLGEFVLEHELGRGGMGIVWQAFQSSMGRRVALKILPPERLWSPNSLGRFRREAGAAARVAHQGIVAVHAIGKEGDVHYIVQELVEGARTLADRTDETRRLSELPAHYDRETARLFLAIAQALAAVHQKGVVHRDVKPTNILLTPDEHPKVADFGLARLEGEPGLSLTGDVIGTPCYMSPEHARSGRDVDARSDIFSLGATLYEALTLSRPFEGDTRREVLDRIEREDPSDPRHLRPRVPKDLAVLCLKALEKRPEHRYGSMQELAADLERFLAGEPILARPASRLRRTRAWLARHPTRATALGLGMCLLLVLAAMGGLVVMNARRAQARANNILRLTDLHAVGRLTERADKLWPVRPEGVAELERWLAEAAQLGDRLGDRQAQLERLRAEMTAGPVAPGEGRNLPPELEELVRSTEAFLDLQTGLIEGTSPEHGWGVAKRLEWARTMEERTLSGPTARAAWDEARTSIADPNLCPAYNGLRIEAQLGLLPLGRDPQSGLWEFAHLLFGSAPQRDPRTGELRLEESSALVLVLLPGGSYSMGAQRDDPGAPNYDAAAQPNEGPVNTICLRPFFISKFEMTQSQWIRCAGNNPSKYTDKHRYVVIEEHPLLHPIEGISWQDCQRMLNWFGLSFPTEAQWEYAARGTTSTPWWTGPQRESLVGAANIADQSAARAGYDWVDIADWPDFDDGMPEHARVDSLRANPFGLHHVHGNVLEWCLDGWCTDRNYVFPADERGFRGCAAPDDDRVRVLRGGCLDRSATRSRSSYRSNGPWDLAISAIGVRPARSLD